MFLVANEVVTARQSVTGDGVSPEQVDAGELLFRHAGGYERAVMLDSRVDFRVSGLIANVTLQQSFRNTGDDWREAVYVFPLPEQAAVRDMRIRVGERVIEGEIRERAEAQRDYQAAKSEGKRAGLVEQERPNLFTVSVANIAPGETIAVELVYVETLQYDSGEFSLRFPMTVTPRYIPGAALNAGADETVTAVDGDGWSYNTDQVPDAARITPLQDPHPATDSRIVNPITIQAEIDAGMPLAAIDSPWHDIRVDRDEQRYRVALRGGPVSMTRDFELRWRPDTGRQPQAAWFTETLAGEHYGLLMLVPPARTEQEQVLPREMILVIDTSGSMGGASIRQARAGLSLALDKLRPGDRFNVIEFNNRPQALFRDSRPASREHIDRAREYVANLEAGGGTEMRAALDMALSQQAADESLLRQVLFITDGAVGNEAALFGLIDEKLGRSRLFTVGIGSAPNSHFMRKAAEFGRGSYTYIGAVDEVGARMAELFGKLEHPVAGDLTVDWPAGVEAEAYPAPIPDLYQGEVLLLAARLDDISGAVTLNGRTTGQRWQRRLPLTARDDSSGVASVWARRKIAALLDEKISGRDAEAVRADVLETALAHQLLSPYTSFLAVDKTPVRSLDADLERESVLNARPHGQSAQPYAWPATATDSRFNMLIGVLLLLLAFVNWWQNRRPRHG
ncbi:marine proteobacterial sortase target protein [Methylohalomonas lacus]|uniref:marine proteobacterial sortase target protein n=1 Tax=Methylohalomonas lacus TaxID=398773 RepID=UPI002166DE5D|nr:marine proteobacterial sortase target protein [Methylohalomonas lacus]